MKKTFLTSVLAVLVLSSCNDKKAEKEEELQSQEINTELAALKAEQANNAELLTLINDINDDMESIKQMEGIITLHDSRNLEGNTARQQIKDNIQTIKTVLVERRQQLEELEKKLNASANTNATLNRTIATLKRQLNEQDSIIGSLRDELTQKNIVIEEKDTKIDELNETLHGVREAKNQAEEQNVKLNDELNTCYYVVGTSKELKANDIIEKKFLRREKIMPGDVDTQFFIKADKRTLDEIDCHNKKAKVKTDQPQSSYEFITKDNGEKILVIKNKDEFWKKSDFLVIEIG